MDVTLLDFNWMSCSFREKSTAILGVGELRGLFCRCSHLLFWCLIIDLDIRLVSIQSCICAADFTPCFMSTFLFRTIQLMLQILQSTTDKKISEEYIVKHLIYLLLCISSLFKYFVRCLLEIYIAWSRSCGFNKLTKLLTMICLVHVVVVVVVYWS